MTRPPKPYNGVSGGCNKPLLNPILSNASVRDMATHGSPPTEVPEVPNQVDPTCQKPADLQVGPETLSTIPATLEDLGRPHPDSGRPTRLVAQVSPLDRGAAPSKDHGILFVITEGDLRNL
jgi:hypothetical protein